LRHIGSPPKKIHSLKHFYTGVSQVPNFPEFVIVGLMDELQVEHYDSNTRRYVPKQDWANRMTEDDQTYWDRYTQIARGTQQWFKGNIEILKQRLNQTGGVHVYQWMYGCEWEDETDEVVNGYWQDGFDGEDFLVLDLKTETWIAPVQQAVPTKQQWENDKAMLARYKHYYNKECVDWLKKYVEFGRSSLMRKDLPSVSLLQKTPSSPLTCHATGFYPDRQTCSGRKTRRRLKDEDWGGTAVCFIWLEDRKSPRDWTNGTSGPTGRQMMEVRDSSFHFILSCVFCSVLMFLFVDSSFTPISVFLSAQQFKKLNNFLLFLSFS
uniref:MHC class I-like antigen recognition-like domain-containing protein n=1 Tax=Salarias fasciatus TaxID=181472 RepID=A0A672FFE4_SALFA